MAPANPRLTFPSIPPFVQFILKTLHTAGYRGWIVGGAVRDAILDRPINDWDVVTSAPPEQLETLFPSVRHFSLRRGTLTLVHSGKPFEVSSFRGEKHILRDDLAHRDFTINALAYAPERDSLVDPFGGGKDLKRGTVRAVGSALERFQEDPIRLLRAVRLAGELGFSLEAVTRNTIKRMAPRLQDVARERVRDEISRILLSQRPSYPLRLMVDTELLAQVIPELLEGSRDGPDKSTDYTLFHHGVKTLENAGGGLPLRLAALLHDIGKPRTRRMGQGPLRFPSHAEIGAQLAESILRRLRFSQRTIREVALLIQHHSLPLDQDWEDAQVRRLVFLVGSQSIGNLLSLRRGDLLAYGLHKRAIEPLRTLQAKVMDQLRGAWCAGRKDLAIGGEEVMEILGIPPGPIVGSILDRLLHKVIQAPELNTKGALTALLGEWKGENP